MSQRPDPVGNLELLSAALVHAVQHDDMDEVMALLNERERVITLLLASHILNPDEAQRVEKVARADLALAEMLEVEQQKVGQSLRDLHASRKGRSAYKRAA